MVAAFEIGEELDGVDGTTIFERGIRLIRAGNGLAVFCLLEVDAFDATVVGCLLAVDGLSCWLKARDRVG